jgi:hypothetical protein
LFSALIATPKFGSLARAKPALKALIVFHSYTIGKRRKKITQKVIKNAFLSPSRKSFYYEINDHAELLVLHHKM